MSNRQNNVSNVSQCLSLIQSQISPASKAAYREYLGKLEQLYGKLLVSYQETLCGCP